MAQPADLSTPLAYALAYAGIGWHVLPLEPRGKQPFGRLVPRGMLDATVDEALIRRWWRAVPEAGIGISLAMSGLVAIDVDPRNGGQGTFDDLQARHGALRSEVMAFTGGGGEHHVFVLPPSGHFHLPGTLGPGIDVKANGYIVVEPSVHPSGQRYGWEASSNPLQGVAPSPLPDWLRSLRVDLGRWHRFDGTRPVNEKTLRELREAIHYIDPDPYESWINAGMALHATGWGHAAYALWCGWSQGSSKFDATECRHKWESFHGDGGLTVAWLFGEAQKAGWSNPAKRAAPQDDPRPEPPSEDEPQTWLDVVEQWQPDSIDELIAVPPLEWLMEGWIQRCTAGAMVAEGGTGKTTLALHLMCCIATGRPCFGCSVRPGSSVLLSLDDPQEDLKAVLAELLRCGEFEESELEAIRQRVRLISLRALPGCKQFAMREHGGIVPTGIECRIVEALCKVPELRLLSLDTLRMFSGSDSNDERAMTIATQGVTFMADNLLCAVMSAHHTGKGQAREKTEDQYAGAGSSAIADNLRFVLRLRNLTHDEAQEEFDGWMAAPDAHLLKLASSRGSLRVLPADPILIERNGYALRHIDAFSIPKPQRGKPRESHSDILRRLAQNGMRIQELRFIYYRELGDVSQETKKKAFQRACREVREQGFMDISADGFVVLLGGTGT